MKIVLMFFAVSAFIGCRSLLFPVGRPFTGTYQILFRDSTFIGMVGDTSEVEIFSEPYSPEEYGLKKVIKSLDENVVRLDADNVNGGNGVTGVNGRAICRSMGKTRFVAALIDEDGRTLAADTLVATVPLEKVLTLYHAMGDCAEVQIRKGAEPGTLFLLNKGAYKSTDNGKSWDSLDLGPGTPGFNHPSAIVANPFDSRELYAVDVDTRILHSMDAGATWNAALTDYARGIQNLVYDPGVPNTLFMLRAENDTLRVYRSGDNGSTFAKLSGMPYYHTRLTLLIDPQDSRLMYLSPSAYLSRDGGVTWTTSPFKISGQSISHLKVDSQGRVYSVYQSLIRSDDHGETWETLYLHDKSYYWMRALDVSGEKGAPMAFFHPTTKTIYFSDNDGYAWTTDSIAAFSFNSCGYGDIALIQQSPPVFLLSDGLFVWRYRYFGN